MAAKKGFSERAWEEIINSGMDGKWIDALIADAKKKPDGPFADLGPVLEAMLKKGVNRDDICRLVRFANYEAVFSTVMLAGEEELDAEALESVHEELLTADPSGKEGRPGSWPIEAASKKKSKAAPSDKPAKPRNPDEPLLKLAKADDYAFSPAGDVLALSQTSNTSTTIRLFAFPSGELLTEFNSLPNLRGLAYLPDGSAFAVANHSGLTALHDAKTGKELWRTPKAKKETFHFDITRDGKQLLWLAIDQYVRRCDAKTGKMLPPIDFGPEFRITEMASSPDGKTLALVASTDEADIFSFWDLQTDKEIRRDPNPHRDMAGFRYLADGKYFLINAYKGFRIWDIAQQKTTRTIDIEKLTKVSLDRNEKHLAALTYENAHIIDFANGAVLKTLSMENLYPDHFAFSPDAKHVVLVISPKTLVWETKALIGG